MNNICKIDRNGLTDAQYIKALEISNATMADELFRLRMALCEKIMSNRKVDKVCHK